MYEESSIFDDFVSPAWDGSGFSDPELLFSNSRNSLYRLKRNGKFFLVKVGKDAFSDSLLRREAELSSNLSHPYLLHIWSYEENTPVGPGLVMEYVNGRTLGEFLLEQPSSEIRRRVFTQFLEVVSYLHHAGIRHNDLKPDNILITSSDNDVKLIDLGLSDNDAHGADAALGMTRAYASPELLSRSASLDCRSDIYAVGRIMQDIWGHRYSRISRKACRKSPDSRYSSIDSLSIAWKRRNFPLQLCAVLIVALLVALPSFFYFREHAERQALQESILSKEKTTASLARIIDARLAQRYEQARDSIGFLQDPVARILCVNHYLEYSWKLMDSLHACTSDIEVSARIDARCNQVRNSHQDKLMSLLEVD